MAGADTVGSSSVEKLEDVIVRSAEQVAGQIRGAKEAISTVIFGQDRGKQPDQSWPADRRAHIIPSAVGCDSHIEIAAKGWIPQMHRRQAFSGRAGIRSVFRRGCEALKVLNRFPPLLRHGLP